MEWAVGELTVKGSEQEVLSLNELEKNIKYKLKMGKYYWNAVMAGLFIF